MSRNTTFENDLLAAAERQAGLEIGYADRVRARLTMGQELYGNAWAGRPLVDMIREIREEAWDVGAWASLAAQLADRDVPDGEAMMLVRMRLQRAVACAVAIDEELRQILDLLAD